MNLVINPEQYNSNNIHLIKKSKFKTSISYETNFFSMNGLYIYFQMFNHMKFCKDHIYRCPCIYTINKYIIQKLIQIEKEILSKHCVINKKPLYTIFRQLTKISNTFGLTEKDPQKYNLLIKICGILETDTNYRLIYYVSKIPTGLEVNEVPIQRTESPNTYLFSCNEVETNETNKRQNNLFRTKTSSSSVGDRSSNYPWDSYTKSFVRSL
jgi:hypothetical protein